jgi:putative flavoprotein involved in K+ transport
MSRLEVVEYLDRYARSFAAPVETGVTVTAVEREGAGFLVTTDRGAWSAAAVVVATGHCDVPFVPPVAAGLPREVAQVVPTRYRNPDQLGPGGVLVVGASATGVQLAAELQRSGRPVTLAVGKHVRMPRRYRGRDIQWWLDAAGILDERWDAVADLEAARRAPSLQLVGADDHRTLDLDVLRGLGVRVAGRVAGVEGSRVVLADDLAATLAAADARLARLLRRIDAHAERSGPAAATPPELPELIAPIRAPRAPTAIDLRAEGIRTVLWATGYRRSYPWLRVPVLDHRGEIVHHGGVTPVPGLYVLGLQFLRHRNSSFLDGVGRDALALAAHLTERIERRPPRAA